MKCSLGISNFLEEISRLSHSIIFLSFFSLITEEALQIAEKRRKVKSRGEKERYTHLNAEFKRIARRDKKAFFSNQCKEIEESNRMGKTRDLFKNKLVGCQREVGGGSGEIGEGD